MIAFSQGVVNFFNTLTTLVRTNAAGIGGAAGNTAPSPGGFYYAVFTAPPTVTSLSPADLLTPTWTFTGLYGSNIPTSTGGRLSGGLDAIVPTGWPAGVTNSFVVVGWSANVSGKDWSLVAAQLTGASFQNGVWTGPNWSPSSQGGFFGTSAVGFGVASLPGSALPAFSLFGTTPNAQGTPIGGFDLFVVNVPEPSTLLLAGIATAALSLLCKRKSRRRCCASANTVTEST